MGIIVSQITSITIVYSTDCSGADQRNYQSSSSLAFVWGIHRWLVNSPHKGPVTRKMLQFGDVVMKNARRVSGGLTMQLTHWFLCYCWVFLLTALKPHVTNLWSVPPESKPRVNGATPSATSRSQPLSRPRSAIVFPSPYSNPCLLVRTKESRLRLCGRGFTISHQGTTKMAAILLTTFPTAFSFKKNGILAQISLKLFSTDKIYNKSVSIKVMAYFQIETDSTPVHCRMYIPQWVITLRRYDHYLADKIFTCIFFNENSRILFQI